MIFPVSQKYFSCPGVQTSSLLVSKCKALQMSEVSEPEFVRACSLDGELGNTAVSIYRGFIGCWSFMYERWESGAFFTQTKPPKGNTSHRYFHCIFTVILHNTI